MDQSQDEMDFGPLKEEYGVQLYRRLPLLARVTQYSGQTTYWRSLNVSEGGIFVRAAPTLPPGTELEIGFYLPDGDVEIRCRALVIWRNDANEPDFEPKTPYGMGLEFVDLRPDLCELIKHYIEEGDGVS